MLEEKIFAMVDFLVPVLVIAVAVTLLSVGVIFRKRTPLKGSCHSAGQGKEGDGPEGVCDTCTCGTVAPEK